MSSASSVSTLKVPWKSWEAILVFVLSWVGVPLLILSAFRFAAPYDANIQQFMQGIRINDITASFQLTVLDAMAGLGLIWLVLRKYKVSWSSLGLRKFSPVKAGLLIGGMFVAFIGIVWVALIATKLLVPGFDPDQAQVNEFTSAITNNAKLISFFALVVIPPIIEEILFRGFMFPAFSGRVGTLFGALFSSLLFGFAHLQANVGVYTVVLGLLLCFMYKRTNSIIPGMVLHMINNYVAFAAIMGSK
jgi:membrane protease YdiL (CAAX protease family)